MNINSLKQNSGFDRVRFSAQVFVVGAILSITFFLLSIDLFKTYHSDILILVNTKSELATKQQEQLISTVVEFPQTLSFYDRLLKNNPNVRDVTAELSSDQRKIKWNEMISITRSNENTSVFKISIVASREADAQQLARKTARTLFDTVAFYYDIKKDVDLRIIDGPISKPQILGWPLFLLFSVVGGFAIATFLNFMLFSGGNYLRDGGDLLKRKFSFDFKKRVAMPIEEEIASLKKLYQSDAPYFPKESVVKTQSLDPRIQEMKKLTKKIEPDKYPNFPEMPVRQQGESGGAPDNLPVADDAYFSQSAPYEMPAQAEQEPLSSAEAKEPTPEELKKRLNELLKGNL